MVCTAARSEICDQRERGVHERRRSPKRTSYFVRRTQGRPGALPRGRRVRRGLAIRARGRHASRGQAVVAPSLYASRRFTRRRRRRLDRRRARGARTASARADQSLPASRSKRRTQRWALRSSCPPRTRPARPGSSQRWRPLADRRRGKASLRRRGDVAAKFFPVRWSRNLFLLSARGHEAIMTVREEAKETKRS